jgi:hypothetical protein
VLIAWPSSDDHISAHVTTLDLQLALVLSGVALVAQPLDEEVARQRRAPCPFAATDPRDLAPAG